MIGTQIGSYRVTRKLGAGGMGEVYVAEHALMRRKAVIKVLHPHLSHRDDIVQRFFNEARAAAEISHPGIIDVVDVGKLEDGQAFIMMDHLDGESLAEYLRRQPRPPLAFSLATTRQILGALGAAHERGIVHRDLKPDNVFLVPDSEVATGKRAVILDFGIAKLIDADAGGVVTHTGDVMGTPVYMSPEQCRGASTVDHRTDLYAVGCMLFQMVCGRPPFVAAGAGDLIAMHIKDPAPSARTYNNRVPAPLEAVINELLAKAAGDRFDSAQAVIDALDGIDVTEPVDGGEGVDPTLPVSPA